MGRIWPDKNGQNILGIELKNNPLALFALGQVKSSN